MLATVRSSIGGGLAIWARHYARARPRITLTLLQDLPKVGNKGQVVNVKAGHARNYLIPRQLAVLASREAAKAKAIEMSPENMARRRRALAFRDQINRLSKVALSFTRRLVDPKGNRLQTPLTAEFLAAQIERQVRFRVPAENMVVDESGLATTGVFNVNIKVDKTDFKDTNDLSELNVPDQVSVAITVRAS